MNHAAAAECLGLDPFSSLLKEDVHAAYRKAALSAHPDRGGSNEDFQKVAAAKDILLGEIETGVKIELGDNSGHVSHEEPEKGHSWMGARYDEPSTQSPQSPLRQMGEPIDLEKMQPSIVEDLWRTKHLQCVWRCECCDAVCCRVRRDKFRCICGHQLKEHDARKRFACACPALEFAHPSLAYKGDCKCSGFRFLISHGMWVVKCACKHDHLAHDPESTRCRRCDTGTCEGWAPTWQCHCGHGSSSHSTVWVKGYLGQGHRDWVTSGVRLETARM